MQYNYQKEFFHRPFWTESNVRFIRIVISVFVITLGLTLLLIRYTGLLPEIKIQRSIKEKYISYISNIYAGVKPKTSPAPEKTAPPIVEKAPAPAPSPIEKLIEETTPAPSAKKPTSREASVLNKGRIGGGNSIIAQAIEAVPGLVEPPTSSPVFTPSATYRRKAEEYEIAKVITGAYEGVDYSIPPPEYTDFEIAQGYRDEEEIIMAVNGKKKYIRHCINKYHRNDPSIRGNIVVKFKIHPDGYVIPGSIKIVESDIPDPRVLRCIKRVISRWRDFPKVAYEDGVYTITQKYIF